MIFTILAASAGAIGLIAAILQILQVMGRFKSFPQKKKFLPILIITTLILTAIFLFGNTTFPSPLGEKKNSTSTLLSTPLSSTTYIPTHNPAPTLSPTPSFKPGEPIYESDFINRPGEWATIGDWKLIDGN